MSLLIRMLVTMTRRSVATGCWRASRSNDIEVELGPPRVDLGVGGDHRVGEVDVGVEQGRRGPAHRRRREVGHLDQRLGDAVELLVEGLAHHGSVLRGFGCGVQRGAHRLAHGTVAARDEPQAPPEVNFWPRRRCGGGRAAGTARAATYPDLVDPSARGDARRGGRPRHRGRGRRRHAVVRAQRRRTRARGAAAAARGRRRAVGAALDRRRRRRERRASSTPRRRRSATGWCATASWSTTSCATSPRQVRRDGMIREAELDLTRSPNADGVSVVMRVRVAPIARLARADPRRGPHRTPAGSRRSAATSSPTSATS